MRPGSIFNCEHCSSSFLSKKELLRHSSQHARPTIICPWCFTKPREFGWPQDLRRHIRHHHRSEHDSMPAKLLSSSNCFYFSTLPETYQQLHGSSNPISEEATLARQLMARWCQHHSRDIKKWQEGWMLATSHTAPAPPTVPSSTALSSSVLAPMASSLAAPFPSSIATSTPTCTVTETCTLKRQHEPALSLKSVSISTNEVKVHLQDEDTNQIYLTHLSMDILQDPKSMSAITRRMCNIDSNFTLPSSTWKIAPNSAKLWEEISLLLGIHPKFITTVLTQPGQLFKLVRTSETVQPNIAKTPTIAASLPAQTASQMEHTPQTPSRSLCSEDGDSLRSPSPFSLAGGDTPSYNPESPTFTATKLEDMLTVSSKSPSYNPHSPAFTSSISTTTQVTACTTSPILTFPTYNIVLSQNTQTATAKQVKTQTQASVTCTPAHTSTRTTLLPVTSAQSACTTIHTTTHSALPKPISIPTYTPTPINTIDRLKGMAINLLKYGSLPLLPPAPREWSTVTDESIQITSTLLWPPKNWQTLSADQRALASEFAVLTVHQQSVGKFEILDRSELRHRYNYLVLPGSKGCRLTPLSHTQTSNYKLVKKIALGNLSLAHQQQEAILKSFHPSASTPILTQIGHVPLRLLNTAPPTESDVHLSKKKIK